jgi:hypothetical protein
MKRPPCGGGLFWEIEDEGTSYLIDSAPAKNLRPIWGWEDQ